MTFVDDSLWMTVPYANQIKKVKQKASVFLIMADPRIRQIKIKTGVVKRIAKEKVVYEKEAEQQKARVQKIKDEGQDEHNIRKQEEVLQESLMMVPDCQRR